MIGANLENRLDDVSDIRRDRVLHFATRTFLKQGYDGTSLDDVALASHVSKKTIYSMFGSKDKLLHFVIHEATAETVRIIDVEFDADASVEKTLIAFAEKYIEAMFRPVCGYSHFYKLARLLISASIEFPEFAREYLSEWKMIFKNVEKYLSTVAGRGELSIADASIYTHILFDMLFPMDTYILGNIDPPDRSEVNRMATQRVRTFLYGLAVQRDDRGT